MTSTKEAAESEQLKQSNETNTNFRSSKENIIIQVGNHLAIAFKKRNRSIKSNKILTTNLVNTAKAWTLRDQKNEPVFILCVTLFRSEKE